MFNEFSKVQDDASENGLATKMDIKELERAIKELSRVFDLRIIPFYKSVSTAFSELRCLLVKWGHCK